jgi:hypothetical protein
LPTVNAGQDQTVCAGTSVTLTGTGAAAYSWNNGVNNGVSFTPSVGSTTYTVAGTDAYGCENTDDVIVTVNPHTTASQTQTALDSYTWPVNGQSYTQSGQYTDTLLNAAGCDSTITLNYELVDVGVEDIALQTIEAYPNPFNDQIWMTYDENLIGEVLFILDLSGRILEQYEVSADLKSKVKHYEAFIDELNEKFKSKQDADREEIQQLKSKLEILEKEANLKSHKGGDNQAFNNLKSENYQLNKQFDELKIAHDELKDEKTQLYLSLNELKTFRIQIVSFFSIKI